MVVCNYEFYMASALDRTLPCLRKILRQVYNACVGLMKEQRQFLNIRQTTPDPSLTKEGSLDADTFNSPPILGGVAEGRGGKVFRRVPACPGGRAEGQGGKRE
jgi:hypothetical protein